MDLKDKEQQLVLQSAIKATLDAGQEILKIYETNFNVDYKQDNSPLTLADIKANSVIADELKQFEIPILSEESEIIDYNQRKDLKYLWIVDPLDGTKEFVSRNGEFTVNIALIENGKPVLGVIYVPVKDLLYFGSAVAGSFKVDNASEAGKEILLKAQRIQAVSKISDYLAVVASRSHLNTETITFVEKLKKHYSVDFVNVGSSLKFCIMAEGKAHLYPRFGLTNEWDIAAGYAIAQFASACTLDTRTMTPLCFNKENLRNPDFIVLPDIKEFKEAIASLI